MGRRSINERIQRTEKALKAQSIFPADCICFPDVERPSFGFSIEMEIAGKMKCPLHGERFTPLFHLYIAKRFREKLWKHLWTHHSEQ